MNRKLTTLLIPVLCLLIAGLRVNNMRAQSQGTPEHKTVWSGVYTDEEASRGQTLYDQTCVNCHGQSLAGGASQGGPQLAGDKFVENWREDMVQNLFLKIRNTMPRQGFMGSEKVLSDREALDLVAYIFKKNGFPTGSPLNLSSLGDVWIEQQQGPKPLPNYSQIQTVGCLSQEADNWVLTKASKPNRLRTSGETVDPAVLKAAETKLLGDLKFRLQNLMMLGAFSPETHKGHKMLAQGVLIRQGGSDRLSVTQLQMVSAECGQ